MSTWRIAVTVLIVIILARYRIAPEYVPVLLGSAGWVIVVRSRVILVQGRQL